MTFDADALIDAVQPLLDLTLSEVSRPGVKLNLEIAARLAKGVMDFPLDDEAEPAPVYVP
jgi:hypothetical protein